MSEAENVPEVSGVESDGVEAKKSKFVVASAVRELVRSKGFCVGGDLVGGLSDKVEAMVALAISRATANGRKTLRSSDL